MNKINQSILNTIIEGNSLTVLKTLPSESVNCIITSPPYYNSRIYNTEPQVWGGDKDCDHDWNSYTEQDESYAAFCRKCNAWKGELGLEPTPDLYVEHLVEVFRECKRILRADGTFWLNIADVFSKHNDSSIRIFRLSGSKYHERLKVPKIKKYKNIPYDLPPKKTLLAIPERVVLALLKDGWIRRNTIIWHKPNAFPHSIPDRFTIDFEYIYFYVKSQKYYFERQIEPFKHIRFDMSKTLWNNVKDAKSESRWTPRINGRNKRCIWTVSIGNLREEHFAAFPNALVETMISAGCPREVCSVCGKVSCKCQAEKIPGIVLDPFIGSGTTAIVAKQLGRNYIGIELNQEFIKIAERRLSNLQKESL